jgi:ribosome-associated protein
MEKGKPLPISALPRGERPDSARPRSEERESESPKTGSTKKIASGGASSKTGKTGPSASETKSPESKSTNKSTKAKSAKRDAAAEPSAHASAPGEARGRPGADALLKLILARLDDMKAEETVTIDLRGKSTLADYMVVSSGRANRHVGAIADHVLKDLHKAGIKGTHAEGIPNCDWVLIDAGDVIVHLFRPEVRAFYNLEKMWTAGRDARAAT